MGRYDFRPSRVHKAATRLLGTPKLEHKPSWYDVVGRIPPSQTLVRTQPVRHPGHLTNGRNRKASKQFRPQGITYEEDELRQTFFKDHPWELARPRVVLEHDGKDYQRMDWSKLGAHNQAVNGESVVQRQMHLMASDNALDRPAAYDQVRQELYQCRLDEETEALVSKEEASATGAYFGKSVLQVGLELEDHVYESWKSWADQEFMLLEQRRAGGSVISDNNEIDEEVARKSNDSGQVATEETKVPSAV